ncbi:MAG TPA: DUF433 domain-containing protein [Gemmataceae bacterium]|nr:DUF433 domain-containing protein [Gemmataceae bacterium]
MAVGQKSWVQKTPGINGGDPCIRDTRITVHGLVEWRKLGLTDCQILDAITGLTADDLEAAWDYYSKNRDEIEEIIRAEQEA